MMSTRGECGTLRSPSIAAEMQRRPTESLLRVRSFDLAYVAYAGRSPRRDPIFPCVATLSKTLARGLGQSLYSGLIGALVVLGAQFAGPNGAAATDSAEAIECLALTMYFEARGEPDIGKLAVAHVVVNRTLDARFPRRICDVARQQNGLPDGGCQFSWTCDEFSDRPKDEAAWRRSKALARRVYYGLSRDPTGGALWYHADYVDPAWRHDLARPQRIGRHMFYRDSGASALAAKETRVYLESKVASRMAGDSKRGWKLGQHPGEEFFSPIKLAVASSAPWVSSLAISVHFYSNDSTRRFVRINQAIYAEGDWLNPDVRLEAITPRGVVLRRGSEQYGFLLQ